MVAAKITEIKKPLSAAQAAKLYPHPPNPATVLRHMLNGLGGIKLASFMNGGKRMTDAESVENFLRALTERANGPESPEPQSDAVAENGRNAAKALAGMGI